VTNAGKIATRNWYSGHDMYIKLFADNLMSNRSPPVTAEDGLAVIRTLEDMCIRIEKLETSV
jgi:hypothetical protein